MKLGDFFTSAPHARPVNPRPCAFTAIAKGRVLPGGKTNPHGGAVAARVEAAFVFAGGDGIQAARLAARKRVAEMAIERQVGLVEDDFDLELTYQIIWRVLFEYTPAEKAIGARLFEDVEAVREMIEVREANRLYRLYDEFVKDEHPEGGVSDATFRGAQGAGPGLAHAVSR